MPLKLSTTIGKIQNIPDSRNIEIVNEFLEYMRSNGSSEHHQNNNLKVLLKGTKIPWKKVKNYKTFYLIS
jgi:hypothetical protein